MAILKCTIDTNDIYEDRDFETILTAGLRNSIVKDAKERLGSEKFEEFAKLTSETLVSEIKTKLQNFLDTEIVLTGRYGEKNFVGSIDDLIKTRIDDMLTRSVDSSGKTIQGCTTKEKTWVEWAIEKEISDRQKRLVKDASEQIEKMVANAITAQLNEYKDGAIKKQVGQAFSSILTK